MKKIVVTFLFLTFCSIGMSQENKAAQAISATNTSDLQEISQTVSLDENLKKDYVTLMNMRDEAIANANTSEEKKVIFERIAAKFLSALTPKQLEALKAKPELYKKLTEYSGK